MSWWLMIVVGVWLLGTLVSLVSLLCVASLEHDAEEERDAHIR